MNKRVFIAILIIAATLFSLAACKAPSEAPEKTGSVQPKDTGAAATDVITQAPTAVPTEAPTQEPTPQPTEDTRPLPEAGTMVYYEDFSSYGELNGKNDVLNALGWRILTTGADYALSDWTAELAIKDGRLEVTNYTLDDSIDGKDGYVMMLDGQYMERALKTGSYTLQYDLNYYSAANAKRYLAIVTEYDKDGYNSFHFRIGGYGNNQVHYQGSWFTFDVNDENNLFAARKNTNEKGSTIAYKLLGIETGPVDEDTAIDNFKNVPVTIRVVRENGYASVYMKLADSDTFVQVSQTSEEGNGYDIARFIKGKAVCLKTGTKINGYIDNIAIWIGTGDMPADHTVTYEP